MNVGCLRQAYIMYPISMIAAYTFMYYWRWNTLEYTLHIYYVNATAKLPRAMHVVRAVNSNNYFLSTTGAATTKRTPFTSGLSKGADFGARPQPFSNVSTLMWANSGEQLGTNRGELGTLHPEYFRRKVPQNVMMYNNSNSSADGEQSTPDAMVRSCRPRSRIFFLRVHKTASTSLLLLFIRYARKHKILVHRYRPRFHANYIWPGGVDSGQIIFQHRPHRYRQHNTYVAGMERTSLKPGTLSITILRDPRWQYESWYETHGMLKQLNVSYETFVSDPRAHIERFNRGMFHRRGHHLVRNNGPRGFTCYKILRNPQQYDLGYVSANINDARHENPTSAAIYIIRKMEKQYDLVMITELFPESLMLLRQLLCWSMSDMVLFLHNARPSPTNVSSRNKMVANATVAWNQLDMLVYRHFLRRHQEQVRHYGMDRMRRDLKLFHAERKRLFNLCFAQLIQNETKGRDVEEGSDVDTLFLRHQQLLQRGRYEDPDCEILTFKFPYEYYLSKSSQPRTAGE